jgi:uncharacterized protein YqhQ
VLVEAVMVVLVSDSKHHNNPDEEKRKERREKKEKKGMEIVLGLSVSQLLWFVFPQLISFPVIREKGFC